MIVRRTVPKKIAALPRLFPFIDTSPTWENDTAARLLSWNIQHGGGVSIARILEEIAAYDPDVIAITEFCAKPGVALRAAMRERGWAHVETTEPPGNGNGVAVFSRTPMRRTRPCPAPPEDAARWLDIDLPEYGLGVGVVHIRAAGAGNKHPSTAAKIRFWNAVLAAAEARLHDKHVVFRVAIPQHQFFMCSSINCFAFAQSAGSPSIMQAYFQSVSAGS
jgi:hypothetical protein